MLEIPRTIGDLNEEDYSNNISVLERIIAKQTANIVEGFKLSLNKDQPELNYNFYAEINIDNSKLLDLIIVLSDELPEMISLLFGFYDGELNYGKYTAKSEIINELIKYKKEILEDCYLEFGLIYNTAYVLLEVFVAEAKWIKFWGVDESSFRNIMSNFNLKEVDNIKFIDEYPKAVYPLITIEKDVIDTPAIVLNWKEKFMD